LLMFIACCYDLNADTRSIWRNVTSQNVKGVGAL
jgi:hypothetical protein